MNDDLYDELAELRMGLLSAEIDKRWALRRLSSDLDVESVLRAFDQCNELSKAIFYTEAKLAYQEKKDELIPPRETDLRQRKGAPRR